MIKAKPWEHLLPIIAMLLFILAAVNAFAQPCLNGWSYRVPVYIDNASGSSLSGHQVKVVWNTQSLIAQNKLNMNGNDIRVLSKTGTVLPYWIEPNTFNSTASELWVKVSSIPTGQDTIYLFYGAGSATPLSDGASTFEVFDDFEGAVINTSLWDTCISGSATVSDGEVSISHSSVSERSVFTTQTGFTDPLVAEMYVNSASKGLLFIGLGDFATPAAYATVFEEPFSSIYNARAKKVTTSAPCFGVTDLSSPYNTGNAVSNYVGVWSFQWPSSNTQVYGWPGGSDTAMATGVTIPTSSKLAFGLMNKSNGSASIDWVLARKYSANQPICSLGSASTNSFTASVSSNSPICTGDSLLLQSEASTTGLTYQWAGPNGFNSIEQNPTIANATSAGSGIYTVTISVAGGCGNVTQNVQVEVSNVSVPGSLSGATTVCAGDNQGVVSLSGQSGEVVRWETSTNGQNTWNTINNTTDSLTYLNLSSGAYYRAIVQNGACSEAATQSVQIAVDQPPVGGSVLGSDDACVGNNSGILQLVGYSGVISQWQHSVDGGATWGNTGTTSTTQDYLNLADSTLYRVQVSSGVCSDTFSSVAAIDVQPLPQPAFSADAVCQGSSSAFQNQSQINSGAISSYSWDFGSSTSTATNASHAYPQAGTYLVTLTATSGFGCVGTVVDTAIVHPMPNVHFSTNDACLDETISFTNLSTISGGAISEHEWFFGDNDSLVSLNADHDYAMAATYTVILKSTSNQGCIAQSSTQIDVHPMPTADFAHDTVSIGEATAFYNNSAIASGNLSYTWAFGDGSFSNAINPTHYYGTAGAFEVILVTASVFGCSDTIADSVLVAQPPVADFTVAAVCQGDTSVFTNTSLSTSGNLSYLWSFGDGNTTQVEHPQHVYSAPGTYSATLEITTEFGATDMITKTVVVYPRPVVHFGFQEVCDTVPVQFDNYSVISTGSLSFTWGFGDASGSNDIAPQHLYATSGTYLVQLVAISNGGCADSLTRSVSVHPRPVVDFSFTTACDGNETEFVNTTTISPGIIQSYLWDFGDQDNSITQNPTHRYAQQGRFDVRLIAQSQAGCTNERTKTVQVLERPVAAFGFQNVCFGEAVDFTNQSTISSGNLNYTWELAGEVRMTETPSYTFTQPGKINVQLTVTSDEGCADSLMRQVQVYALPSAIAFVDQKELSRGYRTMLYATGGAYYAWTPEASLDSPFGSSTSARPLETTEYTVRVVDTNGCESDTSLVVTVVDDYKLVASNVLTPDGNGKNDLWVIENIDVYSDATVRIYDRWGSVVYENKAYRNDWGGTNSAGETLADGTYYYVVTFDSDDRIYKGAVTIIRNN